MAEKNSISSSISSILGSPRFFSKFSSRKVYDAETVAISPTSILEMKDSSNLVNPFGYSENPSKSSSSPEIANKSLSGKSETEAIGLALVHLIGDEKDDDESSRMVLFGTKLKVQIPTVNPSGGGTPNSPADFGIKTRNSQSFIPSPGSPARGYFSRQLSLKEMELSEDYTCVITHGPNPKTIHIFDDCIVVNCCHICKQNLGPGKDAYMYRDEKAFCSHECHFQGLVFEETKNG